MPPGLRGGALQDFYLRAIDTIAQRGRLLESRDVRSGSDVAVIPEGAAKILFPDRDPIGALVANGRGRALAEAQLFKVEGRDPATLCAAALTVLATAVTAAYLRARRTARVDPVAVLRAD